MSTQRKIITLDTATPQAFVPQTGSDTYLAPVSLTDASGNEIAFELAYTTNKAAGDDTGFQITWTDIASGGSSLPFNIDAGGSIFSVNGTGEASIGGVTPVAGTKLLLPQEADLATPTLAFGDGDSGIAETLDDTLTVVVDGAQRIRINSTYIDNVSNSRGWSMPWDVSTFTVPVYTFSGDLDTGTGSGAVDQLSQIAGAIEGIRISEASSHILCDHELHAGLTAGTTQTQADGLQLLSSYNQISTVATTGNSVVAPAVRVGRVLEVINDGANPLWLWPTVGDNLGAGVDVKVVVEANDTVTYRGIDGTIWDAESATQRVHGSMFDESNTDAFVVSEANNVTCYHTNGLAAGNELGWTFDAGGGGSSHAITVIADGAASGVDIKVTTGDAHNLAVGAIVSHSNLTSAVYTGVFEVKAIIDSTNYEVLAVYTATDTGTMDEAATLICDVGSSGEYELSWSASATSATNNETFDFNFYKEASVISGSSTRRKFGTAADYGSMSGVVPPFLVADSDKIAFVLTNTDTAGNITVRNLTVTLDRV